MSQPPSASEQVHDPQFEQLVSHLCCQPGMYVGEPVTYSAVVAYLDGFNMARSGAPLLGLHEWLIVRGNGGTNLVWSGLARRQLMYDPADDSLGQEELSIRGLGRLLAAFFEYRRANGLTKIFHDYARWLLRRGWYDGPLRARRNENTSQGATGE